MSEKNEAEVLADALEISSNHGIRREAAAELRRLHAENEALRREREEARRTVREAHEAGTRLTAQRDALLAALELALSSHGVMLASDPQQEAWKVYGVEAKARAAIKAAEEGK